MQAEQFENAIGLINKSNKILITSHTRPDGDACGSIAAISSVLRRMGKDCREVLLSPLASWYEFLFESKVPIIGNDITLDQLMAGEFTDRDLIIIVDTNSYVQLPVFEQWLKKSGKPVLIIDHHVTGDHLGTVELIDTSAAAAGQIVLELFRQAGWQIDKKIAEALFVSLSTDTGWFRFANTDTRAYRDAAELIDCGANPAAVYKAMFQNFSVERMRLLEVLLRSLEFYFDNRCAVQHLLSGDFDRTGATGRDTENLIDECRRVRTVEVALMFVELKDGGFRCSLRSGGSVDVQKIALKYGGGGHRAASGVNLKGSLEEVKSMMLREVAEQFGIQR
jgi:phosphoesterase RecJ-like protein